jgi:predicted GNAT family N-acyltransferase
MKFAIAAFRTSDRQRMAEARHIRQVVFCEEQGVAPHEEWDDKDDFCEHFLLTDDGTPIATARVRPYGPGIFKVERVAVLKEKRGTGAGKAIMDEIMVRLRGKSVVLNAQTAVEEFYKRLGFVSEGDVFVST